MKRALILGILALSFLPSAARARPDSVQVKPESKVITYARYYVADAVRIGAAPAWWKKKDWLRLGLLAAGTGILVWQDDNVREFFQKNRGPTTDQLADISRPFGAANIVQPALIGTFAASTIAKQKRLQAFSVDAWEASQFALTVTGLLKLATSRARPFEEKGVWKREGFSRHSSFPSGHATQAFVLATAVSEHYPQWWLRLLAYGMAAGAAASRVNDDKHFASDLLVGAALGTAVAKTIFKRNEKRRKKHSW